MWSGCGQNWNDRAVSVRCVSLVGGSGSVACLVDHLGC